MTRDRRIAIVLGVLVWFAGAWFGAAEWNPNSATRLATAVSMVEDGDATIDEYDPVIIDKARFGAHLYMDKAPGMTLLALPWVWVADRASGDRASRWDKTYIGDGIWRFLRVRMRLAVAFGPAILTALAAVAMLSLGTALGGSRSAGLFAALGFALGTPMLGWTTTLFGHAVVADMLVIALWAIHRDAGRGSVRMAAAAGAALGWAVTTEVQAVLWAAMLIGWAVWRTRGLAPRPRLVALGTGAAAGIALVLPLALYNQFAFGTPFRLGYQGVVGFAGMDRGVFGLGLPDPALVPRLLFGTYRGLFWVAPVLLIGVTGLAWLGRARATRDVAIVAGGIAVAVLLYNAAYYYWDGGHSTGPRHMVPAMAMLAVGLGPVWAMLEPGRERIAAAALLGVSIALNVVIAATDIAAPDTFSFPLWQHVGPQFVAGHVRTAVGEWLGWPPFAGVALFALVAAAAIGWLARAARKADAAQ